MGEELRWQQRYQNFTKALGLLQEGVALLRASDTNGTKKLTYLEKEGVIQRFEYTYELAWKTLKDYLEYQGNEGLAGPRDVIRTAFGVGLIENGEAWMTMLNERNLTVHTYNEAMADQVLKNTDTLYAPLLKDLAVVFESKKKNVGT